MINRTLNLTASGILAHVAPIEPYEEEDHEAKDLTVGTNVQTTIAYASAETPTSRPPEAFLWMSFSIERVELVKLKTRCAIASELNGPTIRAEEGTLGITVTLTRDIKSECDDNGSYESPNRFAIQGGRAPYWVYVAITMDFNGKKMNNASESRVLGNRHTIKIMTLHVVIFAYTIEAHIADITTNRNHLVFQVNERKVLEQKAYMLFYVRDRKSTLPKRHVDVAHKDSSLINGVGIKEHKCGSTKEASITVGICSPLTATLGNVSDGTHNICRVPTAMKRPIGCDTDVRMKDVNAPMPVLSKWNSTVDKDSSGSIVLPLSCNEDAINEKDSSDNASHKPNDDSILKKSLARCSKGQSISGRVLELSEQKLKEAGQLKSNQECGDDTKIHGFSKGNGNETAGYVTSEIGSDILVTLSDPLRTSKTIPLKANGKTNLKVRKKPYKSHITSMHLSSLIFEVYNSGVKGQLDTGHLQGRMVNEVPKERAGNVETVVMTDKQLAKITSSTSLGETIGLKDLKQSGLMNMLTRGLEETTVVSWDCKQISHLDGVTESGNECVKIGYIGDEWDEHYDQGKRKKVRSSKLNFGGPNPFQEIASKKAKLKRAKLANQPISI
nr:ubiquitin carboxyl-terminal hydrolase 23 [Ipomoea batatas]